MARARARRRRAEDARQRATAPQQPAAPNRAQAREAGNLALQRQIRRAIAPMGLGYITQPLENTIMNPARRQAAGEAFNGLVRDVQQIPSLDLGRVASDTAANVERSVRGLVSNPGAAVAAIPGALYEATGIPSAQREEQAQREVDLAQIMGRDPMPAARRANENTAQLGLTVAAPLALGGSPSILRATGVGVAADAPFALNRNSDQPLQQRLPGALTEMGGVGLFSAGAQGVANRIGQGAAAREQSMNNIRQRAAEFDAAGVRPFLAAVRGSSRGTGATDSVAAPATMMIAENIVGGNARRNLSGAVQDVARGAQDLSGRYGRPPASNVVAGEEVQGAIRRYARGRNEPTPPGAAVDPMSVPTREWSVPQKSEALYDRTFADLDHDAHQQIIGGVQGEILTLSRTQRTMDEIVGSISGTRSRERLTNPTLRTIVDEMTADLADGSLSFRDMRRWRTMIREMKGDDQLRQGISRAELSRIEQALTDDIYQSADNIGGQAAQDLPKIDDWYRREMQLLDDQLNHYYDTAGGETTFQRVLSDARPGGNLRRLQALSDALRDDQRRTLAASIIDQLGHPPKGRAHVGDFDLDAFVTNYQNISPEARRALFGGRGLDTLHDDLGRLATVAGYMKEVRGFTNWSRSGQAAGNFATMTAAGSSLAAAMAGNPIPLVGVIAGAMTLRLGGTLLTNPRVVRLLIGAPKAGQSATAARAWLRRLGELAARDPAVGALLATELSHDAANQSGAPPEQRGRATAPIPQ